MKNIRLLLLLLLGPIYCSAQIALPEFSSIHHGAGITEPGGGVDNQHYEAASIGKSLEPVADGWYFSDTYHSGFTASNGDPYYSSPGSISRFDSLGNMLWSGDYQNLGERQSLTTLQGGNLIHIGFTSHYYDGTYSLYTRGISPSGALNFNFHLPTVFPGYFSGMDNSLDVVQLGSGRFICSGSELVWTADANGSHFSDSATVRFGSHGSFHGLHAAAGEHFYALCDDGLVEYDTMGNTFAIRTFARGELLEGYHGDTLLWCRPGWLFKADTAFAIYDSVAILNSPQRIQLRADGIWVFDSVSVQHFDHSLNPVQVITYPSSWFYSRMDGTTAMVSGNKVVLSGWYQNAAWKTFDFAGNTHDPDYDLRLDSILVDSVDWQHQPGNPANGSLQYDLTYFVTNTGTEVINEFGVCGNYNCHIQSGQILLPGQSSMFSFGRTGPPPPYDGSSGIFPTDVTLFSPNKKLDKDPSDNHAARFNQLVGMGEEPAPTLSLSLYPNPASSSVRLLWRSYVPLTYTVSIHDLAGRSLSDRQFTADDEPILSCDNLASGCYMVRVMGEGMSASFKLLLQD